ncbi:survival protein sure-like phosphatase/nucleotidase [Armillaria luteobubalina]|uniref:Survival protein sure-like phosphatase/nucleotidase n=1 Tax=Armillaria luteobubalina TaxID=153913 RepID=A0AA39QPH5_9AGAR|nr:survival protein sure-like phosphatase/nucleotidase [Armillaria luteobubalina]
MASRVPTVLLTNDDGPPNLRDSPYVFGLYQHLTQILGWNVKVVLPSSQKSWIGKAYHIKEVTKGTYFYPKAPDGTGEVAVSSRPLKDGEIAEWILLDGTPATCANVGLHNLFPGQIDLVVSGPNLGRNSSSAFALSSGTIGAALSASLSQTRSIAISYGTVLHPTPITFFEPAHILGIRIIDHLWNNWGKDKGGLREDEVDLYNVNIPLIQELLTEEGLKICWTTMWRKSYGRLFKQLPASDTTAAGPDAPAISDDRVDHSSDLLFKWSPEMEGLIRPLESALPVGSDGWAIHKGWVSVTPLCASFAEPPHPEVQDIEEKVWKMKL